LTRNKLCQVEWNGPQKPPPAAGLELSNCYQPWQRCSIDELGSVRPCCVYFRSAGNLNRQGFEAVWNSRVLRKLMRTINARPDRICFSCRMPPFDSDQNMSAYALADSLRDPPRKLWKRLRPPIRFSGGN
jgi:MoaA/NifB/PqqE/SkfB family radical SAM enzyme